MNSPSRKLATFFFSIYLAFVFLIVEPAHHHEDGETHNDCSFCLIACLPVENVSHFVLPDFNSFPIEVFIIQHSRLLSKPRIHLKSRAPPEKYSPATLVFTII